MFQEDACIYAFRDMEGQWQRFFMFEQALLLFSLLVVPVQSVVKWMKIEPHTWVSLLEDVT